MEKVKVTRYMPGRRPDYARDSSSSSSSSEDEDEEEEEEEGKVREEEQVEENRKEYGDEEVARDRRLARLRERTTHVERYVNIKYSCTCTSEFLISLYGAPLAQRASYLALHSSLLVLRCYITNCYRCL